MTDKMPLDSTEPTDVREAYIQGMRATVEMVRKSIPAYERLYAPFAHDLGVVMDACEHKINKWAEDHLLP